MFLVYRSRSRLAVAAQRIGRDGTCKTSIMTRRAAATTCLLRLTIVPSHLTGPIANRPADPSNDAVGYDFTSACCADQPRAPSCHASLQAWCCARHRTQAESAASCAAAPPPPCSRCQALTRASCIRVRLKYTDPADQPQTMLFNHAGGHLAQRAVSLGLHGAPPHTGQTGKLLQGLSSRRRHASALQAPLRCCRLSSAAAHAVPLACASACGGCHSSGDSRLPRTLELGP